MATSASVQNYPEYQDKNRVPPPVYGAYPYPTAPQTTTYAYPGTYPTQNTTYPSQVVIIHQDPSSGCTTSATSGYDPYQPPGSVAALASDGTRPTNFGSSFTDAVIRRRFIRNVYAILMLQLAVTLTFICVFVFVPGVKDFVKANAWFYYLSYGVFLFTYIALACCPGVRRRHPWNLILLAVFTLAFSYMTATISSYYDTKIVVMAIGICVVICLTVSVASAFCSVDVTKWGWVLGIVLMVLFFFSIISIMFAFIPALHTPWWHGFFSGLIALIFMAFLAYDTQMILGGRRYELSPEEHVSGALQLYLDVVYIFLGILGLSGAASSN